ncbi:50S ribosomal protein L21e [Candidatus Woesearchaeota archaeon]|nr:50S ribosomal protein L21e [Candidatus Woesearchaeota archaeon]
MARNIGTFRTKTRYKFKKERREKGKISLSKFFQKFNIGDKVCLSVESAIQKGMYHPRFYGRIGEVVGKKKICYEIKIKDGGKEKILVSHPVHLKPVKN